MTQQSDPRHIKEMSRLAAIIAEHSGPRKFQPGDQVLFNGGFLGTIMRYYSEGMIEVRSPSGLVCIPEEDAELDV